MEHSASETVRNPGTFEISGALKGVFGVCAVVGFAVFALGLSSNPTRAWTAYLHNHFYFMSLSLGGLFFASIQWMTGAMWSAPIRRIAESLTAYLPVALLTTILLYFGVHSIYIWSDAAKVHGDVLLEGKAGYLSQNFFVIRNVVAVLLWMLFAKIMIGNSLKQDQTKTFAETARNRSLSPAFMIVFALTFTMASFDQIMSLDPHWYSTIFGVYCFAGMFYSQLALTAIISIALLKNGKLKGIVNENHLHDMGKFMFAFTVFWAYIGFSQFMLIWYANLPEETEYFIRRFHGGWAVVSAFLLFGKFMTPFVVLLNRQSKRNAQVLTGVGIFMLIAQWIDVMWMVQPEFNKEGPVFGFTEIGTLIGFAGVFGLLVSRFLAKNSIVAVGDPRLAESVFHHNQ